MNLAIHAAPSLDRIAIKDPAILRIPLIHDLYHAAARASYATIRADRITITKEV